MVSHASNTCVKKLCIEFSSCGEYIGFSLRSDWVNFCCGVTLSLLGQFCFSFALPLLPCCRSCNVPLTRAIRRPWALLVPHVVSSEDLCELSVRNCIGVLANCDGNKGRPEIVPANLVADLLILPWQEGVAGWWPSGWLLLDSGRLITCCSPFNTDRHAARPSS